MARRTKHDGESLAVLVMRKLHLSPSQWSVECMLYPDIVFTKVTRLDTGRRLDGRETYETRAALEDTAARLVSDSVRELRAKGSA